MSRIKLTYFNFAGGRGEDCRLALFIAGVEFDDDRVELEEWPDRKPTTPFGSIPLLEIEGEGLLSQSNAILGLLGARYGLLPENDFEAARHIAILNAVEDLSGRIACTMGIHDDSEVKRLREELMRGYARQWAQTLSEQIAGPFVGGETIGIADLKLFVAMNRVKKGILDHIPADYFAAFPKLETLHATVAAHPKVAEWYGATT